jgi:hypothetical protein
MRVWRSSFAAATVIAHIGSSFTWPTPSLGPFPESETAMFRGSRTPVMGAEYASPLLSAMMRER